VNHVKPALLAVATVLFAASHASAASITYVLDCTFTGSVTNGGCTPGGPFGTVTLSDGAADSRYLDIGIDLTPGFQTVNLFLNTPSNWTNPTALQPVNSVNIDGINYLLEPLTGVNNVRFETDNKGFNYLYFDLAIRANKASDPWTGTITLRPTSETTKPFTYFDLNPSIFSLLTNDPQAGTPPDPSALVFLAVQRQTDSATPTFSLVGSTTSAPEPATLLLFGSALTALGVRARRLSRPRH
jgi:hypothetical protein